MAINSDNSVRGNYMTPQYPQVLGRGQDSQINDKMYRFPTAQNSNSNPLSDSSGIQNAINAFSQALQYVMGALQQIMNTLGITPANGPAAGATAINKGNVGVQGRGQNIDPSQTATAQNSAKAEKEEDKSWTSKLVNKATKWIGDKAEAFGEKVIGVMDKGGSIWDGIKAGGQWAWDGIKNFGGKIIDGVSKVINWIF